MPDLVWVRGGGDRLRATGSLPQTVLGHTECLVRRLDPVLKEGPLPDGGSRQAPWKREHLSGISESDPGVRVSPAAGTV